MGIYHKDALPPGHKLAEYVIETVLGHGGFGITYLAKDTSLGALVAIKEYLPNDLAARDGQTAIVPILDSRDAVKNYQWGLQRFIKEARALAQYKHPNIVRVLRYMEANGTAYVVMEYEQGLSLAQYLKKHGNRLSEPELLRIVLPILNGLTVLHENDMLHCDIKPDNIYMRIDGTPMLIDFGSARSDISKHGAAKRIILTPGYAPIEQYPDKGQQGPWTDIYAMGATMYRCITGKKPDESIHRYKAILQYQADPLVPVEKLAKEKYQPYMLDCINWSLQVYPKDRPQSARELQDGLMGKHLKRKQTIQTSNSISTPSSAVIKKKTTTRIQVPRKKKKKSKGKWFFAFIILLIGTAASIWFWPEIRPNAQRMLNKYGIAIVLPKMPGDAGKTTASSNTSKQTDGTTKATATKTVTKERTFTRSPSRSVRASILKSLGLNLHGHKDWVLSVAVAPNGSLIATASADRRVRLWDTRTGSLIHSLRAGPRGNTTVAFSPDGAYVAAGSIDSRIRVWQTGSGRKLATLREHAHDVNALVFSPNGKWMISASKDRSIVIWNTSNWSVAKTLSGHDNEIFALAISPDGQLLASAGADKKLRIWDMESFSLLATFRGHRRNILSLAFSPDGKYIASGGAGDGVRLWSVRRGTVVHRLDELRQAMSVAFAPTGNIIVAGGDNGRIVYWNSYNGRFLHSLEAHSSHINGLAFGPSAKFLVSVSRDKSAKIWRR